ncbi:hypothetical protein ZOSMA_19G01200 [Zostera marina]|uniref:Uncharacterized protein n=1 Tax=Zostera marina TaxID=29655 RepID=A0A0K9PQN1_ZOSMR|nr:hypothetical protein ZOSMA_19G01200 [Zostera marina]
MEVSSLDFRFLVRKEEREGWNFGSGSSFCLRRLNCIRLMRL